MASANANLHKAKDAKNDEFYTQLTDVAKELMHYKAHFKDKIVLCNCDDPTWSAFWKYFHLNFAELGLKKLISTHYDRENPTYKMEYAGGDDNDIEVGVKVPLEGNGDFRNQECIELLKEADIVVTNPPFSLFREYVAVLMEHEKEFLIIGNMNAITYKEIFPLIKDNKIWLGCTNVKEFIQPDGSLKKFGNVGWFTNLELLMDDDVTKNSGIIPYVLSDRTKHDEKNLSIRAFTEAQKRRAYERQGHKCPCCVKNGIDTEYAYSEMQGDHIIPWSQGGRTIDSNLQMLCQKCNNDKSNH